MPTSNIYIYICRSLFTTIEVYTAMMTSASQSPGNVKSVHYLLPYVVPYLYVVLSEKAKINLSSLQLKSMLLFWTPLTLIVCTKRLKHLQNIVLP